MRPVDDKKMVTKKMLCEEVAERLNVSKKEATCFTNTLLEIISEHLIAEHPVRLDGLGTFSVKSQPNTGRGRERTPELKWVKYVVTPALEREIYHAFYYSDKK